jgi:hypothetical protein
LVCATETDPSVANFAKASSFSCSAGQFLTGSSSGTISCQTPAGAYWTQSGSNLYPNNAGWNLAVGATDAQGWRLYVAGNATADRVAVRNVVGDLGSIGDYCPGGGLCNPRPAGGHIRYAVNCSPSERGQIARFTAETAQDYGNWVRTDGLYFCSCGYNNSGTTECAWIGIQTTPNDGAP